MRERERREDRYIDIGSQTISVLKKEKNPNSLYKIRAARG